MLLCVLLCMAISVLPSVVRGKEDGERHPLPSTGPTSSSTKSSFVSEVDRETGTPGVVVTTTSSMLTASSVDANPDGGVTAKTASMVMTSTSVTAQSGRGELTADSSTTSSTATTSTSTTKASATPEKGLPERSSSSAVTTTTTTTTSTTTTTRTTVSSRSERKASVGHREANVICGGENQLDKIDATGRESGLLEASHSVCSTDAINPSADQDLGKDRDCDGGNVANEGFCMA
ncbi:uncharacterized protein LOC142785136 [Rhipicephalus microplus]|uniref:uncharacterized protein LOC142785136 n=1 Tax=Rhipicephalus microplus TaxID=6941 RepID=UPI003F6D2FFC